MLVVRIGNAQAAQGGFSPYPLQSISGTAGSLVITSGSTTIG